MYNIKCIMYNSKWLAKTSSLKKICRAWTFVGNFIYFSWFLLTDEVCESGKIRRESVFENNSSLPVTIKFVNKTKPVDYHPRTKSETRWNSLIQSLNTERLHDMRSRGWVAQTFWKLKIQTQSYWYNQSYCRIICIFCYGELWNISSL